MRRRTTLFIIVTLISLVNSSLSPALANSNDTITIEGGGWGHGVGMSQYGAYGRALPTSQGGGGQTASEILSFYYPTATLQQDINVPDDLRVHIFSGLGATLQTSGPIDIKDSSGTTFATLTSADTLTVEYGINEFIILDSNGTNLCIDSSGEITTNHCEQEPISIELNENEPIQTDVISQFTNIGTSGNSYRWGTLTFRKRTFAGGGIYVLLENLPMDKYLYGLAEVPASWPDAALESQAIAGRTYAYQRVISRRANASWTVPWDVYSTVNDQHYTGYSNEIGAYAQNWQAAVDTTSQNVLLKNQSPITTYYTSSNGGATGAGSYVFCTAANYPCSDISYLPAQEDPFDHIGNPYASWTRTYTKAEIGRWIASSSLGSVGNVTGLTISGAKDPYRRTDHANITIYGTSGTVTAKGDSFMSIINNGLSSEGRGKSDQILSTFYFFPNFALSDNRVHQNYAGLMPAGWTGSEYADGFGETIVAGDFNGDHSSDFVAGVPKENIGSVGDAGLIHVVYGGNGGIQVNDSIYQGEGGWPGTPETGDQFGAAMASGDFNGDGFDDLIVGSPGDEISGFKGAGMVTIAYGSATGLGNQQIFHQNSAGVAGSALSNERFGAAVASGDLNADGYDDVVIGVPGEFRCWPHIRVCGPVGAIQLLYGSANGITAEGNEYITQRTNGIEGAVNVGEEFGASVATGDLDGDGYDDVVVGVPGEYRCWPHIRVCGPVGAIQLLYGSENGIRSDNDQYFGQRSNGVTAHPNVGDRFGASVSTGDINGDGYDDVVLGIPGDYRCWPHIRVCGPVGAIMILYGSENGTTAVNDNYWGQRSNGVPGYVGVGDEFGAVVTTGDLNEDGYDDVIIGVPGETISSRNDAGAVQILYGSAAGSITDGAEMLYVSQSAFTGTSQTNARFGSAITAIGNDLIIGAPGDTVSGITAAGSIYHHIS